MLTYVYNFKGSSVHNGTLVFKGDLPFRLYKGDLFSLNSDGLMESVLGVAFKLDTGVQVVSINGLRDYPEVKI